MNPCEQPSSPVGVPGAEPETSGVRIRRLGDAALIADFPDLPAVLRCYRCLNAGAPPAGVTDVVPAARTIVVTFRAGIANAAQLRSWIAQAARSNRANNPVAASQPVTIAVSYTGPDLAAVAGELEISSAELVRWHSSTAFTAAFTGFAPGFAYLVPVRSDDALPASVPRRQSPRTKVPAGSVGLAGEFSAVYPTQSPGGWQLIGSTTQTLWDPEHREHPALLQPGTTVRFSDVTARSGDGQ